MPYIDDFGYLCFNDTDLYIVPPPRVVKQTAII